jgi:hypothetical protein
MFNEIDLLAQQNLTPKGYELFTFVNSKLPNIWNRYSSSTMKYHKKEDGSVPTIAEHTFEMLDAAIKILPMFGTPLKSSKNDAVLLAIIFHDGLKYGKTGKNPHTTRNHDQEMADLVVKNKALFLSHFSEVEFDIFQSCIRLHSGRWSPDAKTIKDFSFNNLPCEVMFVHIFDMLSTKDCLK